MMDRLEVLKSRQAGRLLDELDLDCWLIWVRETDVATDPALRLVYRGSLVWPAALIQARDGTRVAVVGRFDAGTVPTDEIDRVIPYDRDIRPQLLAVLQELDPRRIAIDVSVSDVGADGMTAGMRDLLAEHLAGTPLSDRLVSAEELIGKLRGRKLPEEIGRVRRAVGITERIFEEAFGLLAVGQTEREIHSLFRRLMDERGVGPAWAPDHDPAVDAGPEKAFGHAGPTDRTTRLGHLLHFDFGVRVDGYCSDLQRMVFFGSSSNVPEEVARAFETVRDAIARAAGALRPGKTGEEIDTVARRFVTERGYPEFMHALGHQLGRAAHDGGTLLGPPWERYGASTKGLIEPGNLFTLELHVPTGSYGQVSLEEDVLVTERGSEFLSQPQRELVCIDRG
jgi:Xaa-Pro aminopeptidase